MNKAQAIHQFWSSFNLPAYDQNTVPDNAKMPYITYSVSDSEFEYPTILTGSLWYRSSSWEEITLKSYDISKSITLSGKLINIDGGKVWIKRGNPFAQRMADVDDTVRRIAINITVEYFTDY
jgi:hypothetical protein